MLHVPTYLAQNPTPTSTPCKGLGDQHGHALFALAVQQSDIQMWIDAVHAAYQAWHRGVSVVSVLQL
jgi:hypothetical protein